LRYFHSTMAIFQYLGYLSQLNANLIVPTPILVPKILVCRWDRAQIHWRQTQLGRLGKCWLDDVFMTSHMHTLCMECSRTIEHVAMFACTLHVSLIRQVVQKLHKPHSAFGHCAKPQGELQYFELINPLEMTHMNTIFNILSMRLSNQIRWIQSFAIEFPHWFLSA
jgi:hypothetical protein